MSHGIVPAAYVLAEVWHKNQYRKNTQVPYIFHPLAVARRLGLWGIERDHYPEVWAAAYCHDLIEDCEVDEQHIRANTTERVGALVSELTFRERIHREPLEAWREAKHAYLVSFWNKSSAALVIKVADRLENTCDFLEEYIHSSQKGRCYALKYWREADCLAGALEHHRPAIYAEFGPLVFSAIVADMARMDAALSHYDHGAPR
jgi:(p)ppGpp synthase/HD superfamily hydrolase